MAFTCILTLGIEALATSPTFNKKYVDSNTWSEIVSDKKDSGSGYCSVTVNGIYKADKSPSNYKKVKVTCRVKKDTAITKSSYTAPKGKICIMSLEKEYQVRSRDIILYAQGNDPSLDCWISEAFNAD